MKRADFDRRVSSDSTEPAAWADLSFIRSKISVREVARSLGLEVRGNSARCWRTDAHQHNDRSPSLFFTKKNRWRCAVCDDRSRSNLDLVMSFLECDLQTAVEWVLAQFEVPRVPAGTAKHVNPRALSVPRIRAGVGSALDDLVRLGVWSQLSKESKLLLVVLLAFSDPLARNLKVTISQRALRRYCGLSFNGVTKGLRELGKIALVSSESGSHRGVVRSVSTYVVRFEEPRFLELAREIATRFRREIGLERSEQRGRREKKALREAECEIDNRG